MKFTIFLIKTKEFLIKRLTELLALTIIVFSAALMTALVSYSPDDPNFIIDQNIEVQNVLGFRGSIISDFLYQSVGLIALLIPITLFFSGFYIFVNKKLIYIIDNLFFCLIYIIGGSIFFSFFKNESFFLTVNGNGGFIGLFFINTSLSKVLTINLVASYYFLIFFILYFFLISINFKFSKTLTYIKNKIFS